MLKNKAKKQGEKASEAAEALIQAYCQENGKEYLKKAVILNPIRKVFGLEELAQDLQLIDLELYQVIQNNPYVNPSLKQELLEDKFFSYERLELDLIENVCIKTTYKSSMLSKLNIARERINEINKLKYVTEKATILPKLTEDRDINIIDSDIVSFVMNSTFCDERSKSILLSCVYYHLYSSGYLLLGTEENTSCVDNGITELIKVFVLEPKLFFTEQSEDISIYGEGVTEGDFSYE